MDAAIPMDAKNAPTGIWKTAQNAVSHERPHPSSLVYEEDDERETPHANQPVHQFGSGPERPRRLHLPNAREHRLIARALHSYQRRRARVDAPYAMSALLTAREHHGFLLRMRVPQTLSRWETRKRRRSGVIITSPRVGINIACSLIGNPSGFTSLCIGAQPFTPSGF